MKMVQVSKAQTALQLVLGIDDAKGQPVVVLAMERDPDGLFNPNWLRYAATPERAREIAAVLIQGADLIEGKLADEGQFDANVDHFKDHHG